MGQLTNKGFTVTMSRRTLSIAKGDLHFEGFKTSTLYTCSLYSEKPVHARILHSVQALPIKMWHDRMGHLNWEAIKAVKNHPDNPPILTTPPSLASSLMLLIPLAAPVLVVYKARPNTLSSRHPLIAAHARLTLLSASTLILLVPWTLSP